MRGKTTEQFIKDSQKIHGCKYNYSKTKYKSYYENVLIICPIHGNFKQTSGNHLSGNGCQKCALDNRKKKLSKTTQQFIREARIQHDNRYKYPRAIYKVGCKVIVTCTLHGDFSMHPLNHLNGQGCPKCGNARKTGAPRRKLTTLIKRFKDIHGNMYDYSKTTQITSCQYVDIICRTHGEFCIRIDAHISGGGCPRCNVRGFSKIAIKWVEQESKSRGMKGVLHADNGGEFIIPGTKFKVDGYHPRTKTVFEFHGDAFHGNPNVYPPRSKPNFYHSNKTAKRLYLDTQKRIQFIRKLGYKVVEIWESDFKNKSCI